MKKVTYTVLFLLGLVLQPYAGVVSASIRAADGENMSSSMDMTYSGTEMDADNAAKPCHEMAQDDSRCCDFDCLNSGHCTSYCASFSQTAIGTNNLAIGFFGEKHLPSVADLIAYDYRRSPFIYHPPKISHTV